MNPLVTELALNFVVLYMLLHNLQQKNISNISFVSRFVNI